MRLVHLALTDFRNFTSLQTEIPTGPTIVVGANAQGKTSLLEAVYYLVAATSRHASQDSQLICLDAEPRNALLKQLQERRGDADEISFWDKRLAELGAEVMLAPVFSFAHLQILAAPIHT